MVVPSGKTGDMNTRLQFVGDFFIDDLAHDPAASSKKNGVVVG